MTEGKEREDGDSKQPDHLKSYVIRGGRMSPAQTEAFNRLLPVYGIEFAEKKCDLCSYFPVRQECVVEVGFGAGTATVEIARNNSDINYIGIEVYPPGIGRVLSDIGKYQLNNLRVIRHDAFNVFRDMIRDETLRGVHIFFPDPWPKRRHEKRRLFQRPFLDLVLKALVPGGYIYFVTDWKDYGEKSLRLMESHPQLDNGGDGYSVPASWRPVTRFEEKGISAGHAIYELYFIKK